MCPSDFKRSVSQSIRTCGSGTICRGESLKTVPDLLHVQYTAPITCSAPIVVSVHDVSFLEHPEYFTVVPRACNCA